MRMTMLYDPNADDPTCPVCEGEAEMNRWEGRCIEGGYNEQQDRYGCGWSYNNFPE